MIGWLRGGALMWRRFVDSAANGHFVDLVANGQFMVGGGGGAVWRGSRRVESSRWSGGANLVEDARGRRGLVLVRICMDDVAPNLVGCDVDADVHLIGGRGPGRSPQNATIDVNTIQINGHKNDIVYLAAKGGNGHTLTCNTLMRQQISKSLMWRQRFMGQPRNNGDGWQ